ncbi:hypothetical protein Tco_0993798, partial [Tanacetum coccineum]
IDRNFGVFWIEAIEWIFDKGVHMSSFRTAGNASFTFDLGAAVLTGLAVLIDAAALGELCLAALTGTCPDFVATVVGTKFLLRCG